MSNAQRRAMFARLAEHGSSPLAGDIAARNKAFYLPVETAVYVPSTKGIDRPIEPPEFKRRIRETQNFMAKTLGGYSQVQGTGGFTHGKGRDRRVVREDVAKVVSFGRPDDYANKVDKTVTWLKGRKKKWKQASMGYEVEGDLMYI